MASRLKAPPRGRAKVATAEASAVPQAPLFQAKLRPPLDAVRVLARASLPGLDALESARIVLLNAPAGFGKTTALCQLERAVRDAGVPTAWVTLDADDNDLARFAAYLGAALARCVPAADGVRRGAGLAAGALGEAFEAIDSIAATDAPFALFLDDFEKLADAEVLRLVARLVLTLGPRQQLFVGTRVVPELGLARLRASGQLAEIDLERLRFSAQETRRFLIELRGCRLEAEDVAFLHEKSEGWPAALQLAVLALGDHPEGARRLRSFGGTAAQVADYLASEVLARLPTDLREWILRVSVLDSFCAELCDEVTGMPGGAGFIERASRASLFVTALDSERLWFRFHPLFAEFLRSRLAREDGIARAELHRRAAEWLALHGQHAAAVDHALRTADAPLAASIMAEGATRYLHEGRVTTLVRWSEAIPVEVLARHPVLHFDVALANVVSHRYAEAQRLVDAVDGAPPADLAMVRFNLAIWSDRLPMLRGLLDQAMKLIKPADGFLHASMLNCMGYLGFLEGNDDMARSALAAAKASSHHRDNEVVRAYSEGQAGMSHLVRGELREARGIAGAELARLAATGSHYGTPSAIVAVVLADALYETNELAAARVLLDEHLEVAHESCIPDLIVSAFLDRSRIARIEGEVERADDLAGRLQRMGERRGLPRLVASAQLEKARVALVEGRIESAAALVRESASAAFWSAPVYRGTFGNDLENPEVAAARVELFRGGTGAIAPLEVALRGAEAAGRLRRALKLRALLAQALWISGQRRPAVRQLQQALAAAVPEGLVRVIADEPWVLRDMVDAGSLRDDAALGAYAARIVAACGPSPATPRAAPRDAAREILSRREVEVLGMLAHGLTNKEIARKLSRSEATVATHLRRIYEKLGAHTRTQAIAVARRGGLID
jgi:LuxR family maltose regulon positive regulatory protein